MAPPTTTGRPSIARSTTNGARPASRLADGLQDAAEVGVGARAAPSSPAASWPPRGRPARRGPRRRARPPARPATAPSPSATISSASWRSSASIASPRASSSGVSGSICHARTRRWRCTNTASLVDSWPSTEMRSNERLTVTPVSRSTRLGARARRRSGRSRASWRSAARSCPPPFAWAASRTLVAGRAAPPRGRRAWGPGRWSGSPRRTPGRSGPSASRGVADAGHQPCRAAARARSRRSRRPPPPSASRSSASAAARCWARAVASPRSPSETLALPEFTVTARSARQVGLARTRPPARPPARWW